MGDGLSWHAWTIDVVILLELAAWKEVLCVVGVFIGYVG